MKTTNTQAKYVSNADYLLKGKNYITVMGDLTPEKNGIELQTVYNLAKKLKPNKQDLSATNRMKLIVYPGLYIFNQFLFELDTPFIDIVSATGMSDVQMHGLSINTSNVFVSGINCGNYQIYVSEESRFVEIKNSVYANFNTASPKILNFIGILNQVPGQAPIVQPINEDADDYIAIGFTLDNDGSIKSGEFGVGSYVITNTGKLIDNKVVFPASETGYNNQSIDVKMRVIENYINEFSIISCKSNETGDEVMIRFNKKLSTFMLSKESFYILKGFDLIPANIFYADAIELNDYILTLKFYEPVISFGENFYVWQSQLEGHNKVFATDCSQITYKNFTVLNLVAEIDENSDPVFLRAESTTGNNVRLVFNKPISDVGLAAHPVTIYSGNDDSDFVSVFNGVNGNAIEYLISGYTFGAGCWFNSNEYDVQALTGPGICRIPNSINILDRR